jgi:hypothetical protein
VLKNNGEISDYKAQDHSSNHTAYYSSKKMDSFEVPKYGNLKTLNSSDRQRIPYFCQRIYKQLFHFHWSS